MSKSWSVPSALKVGGIIVVVTTQRGNGTRNPGITAGATVLRTVNNTYMVVQVARYTGGQITLTYGTGTDAQMCCWYFNNAKLGGVAQSNNTMNGPALACQAKIWVLNLYAWNKTYNIQPINTTNWGNTLPVNKTWPNCCGMAKYSAAATTHNPGNWTAVGNRTGVNVTLEIRAA